MITRKELIDKLDSIDTFDEMNKFVKTLTFDDDIEIKNFQLACDFITLFNKCAKRNSKIFENLFFDSWGFILNYMILNYEKFDIEARNNESVLNLLKELIVKIAKIEEEVCVKETSKHINPSFSFIIRDCDKVGCCTLL